MKTILFSALIALIAIKGNAQQVIVNHVYDRPRYHEEWHHHHHHDNDDAATAAAVTVGVLGIAAIIAAAAGSSDDNHSSYQSKKQAALDMFRRDLREADRYYNNRNYNMALRYYTTCSKSNRNYNYTLGNQDMLDERIDQCNYHIYGY